MSSTDSRSRGAWVFYVAVLPLCWAACSRLHFSEPGDEYGMYFVSSLAGSWFLVFGLVETGDIHQAWIPWSVAGVGAVTMAGFGSLLALLRLRPLFWMSGFAVAAGLVLWQTIASHPSLEAALAKNGSWQAYFCFSFLIGSYVATFLGIALGYLQSYVGLWRRDAVRGRDAVT